MTINADGSHAVQPHAANASVLMVSAVTSTQVCAGSWLTWRLTNSSAPSKRTCVPSARVSWRICAGRFSAS